MNNDTINVANFIANELRASSPYKTGNMQRSIAVVTIDNDTIDIVIAVDYASYVNNQKKHYHWIETVLDRCARCLTQGDFDDTNMRTGISYDIIYGGKEE